MIDDKQPLEVLAEREALAPHRRIMRHWARLWRLERQSWFVRESDLDLLKRRAIAWRDAGACGGVQ